MTVTMQWWQTGERDTVFANRKAKGSSQLQWLWQQLHRAQATQEPSRSLQDGTPEPSSD